MGTPSDFELMNDDLNGLLPPSDTNASSHAMASVPLSQGDLDMNLKADETTAVSTIKVMDKTSPYLA